jgi:hypothetical protein
MVLVPMDKAALTTNTLEKGWDYDNNIAQGGSSLLVRSMDNGKMKARG